MKSVGGPRFPAVGVVVFVISWKGRCLGVLGTTPFRGLFPTPRSVTAATQSLPLVLRMFDKVSGSTEGATLACVRET